MTNTASMSNPVQQAAVVINCQRGGGDYRSRLHNFDTGKTLYNVRPKAEVEVVVRGDILMRSRCAGDFGSGPTQGNPVYNNLNGVYVSQSKEEALAKREIEKSIIFAGVASSNESGGNNPVFPSQLGGTQTIYNTSVHPLEQLDLIELKAPAADLSDCTRLPGTAVYDAEAKIRPLTEKVTFDLTGSLRETIAIAPRRNKNSNEPLIAVMSGKEKANPEFAIWRALVASASVGVGLFNFIGEALQTAGLDPQEAATGLGQFYFGKAIPISAAWALLMGCPWVPTLPTIGVVNLNAIREKVVTELYTRFNKLGCAYGSSEIAEPSSGNIFGLKKLNTTNIMVRASSWDHNTVEISGAIAAVENLPELLTVQASTDLRNLHQRIVGRVLNGGAPGAAMDVLLSGSMLPL